MAGSSLRLGWSNPNAAIRARLFAPDNKQAKLVLVTAANEFADALFSSDTEAAPATRHYVGSAAAIAARLDWVLLVRDADWLSDDIRHEAGELVVDMLNELQQLARRIERSKRTDRVWGDGA